MQQGCSATEPVNRKSGGLLSASWVDWNRLLFCTFLWLWLSLWGLLHERQSRRLARDILSENFRDCEAVFGLVVLQDAAQSSLSGAKSLRKLVSIPIRKSEGQEESSLRRLEHGRILSCLHRPCPSPSSRRTESQALSSDNQYNLSMKQAPCTLPGTGTKPRDRTSWKPHCSVLQRRCRQPKSELAPFRKAKCGDCEFSPGMEGRETCRILRRSPSFRQNASSCHQACRRRIAPPFRTGELGKFPKHLVRARQLPSGSRCCIRNT